MKSSITLPLKNNLRTGELNQTPVSAPISATIPDICTQAIAKERSEIQLFLYSEKESATVLELWKHLEQRLGDCPLTASSQWTACWVETYREVVRPWFVVALSGQTVCGLCLLSESRTQKIGPWMVHSLHLGTAGEPYGESVCVEYNDLLVEPEYREEFLHKLQQVILHEPGWDQFHLDGIAGEESQNWPLWDACKNQPRSATNSLQIRTRVRESRYFDLEESRQSQIEILDMLGKSTRSNLKRRLKQIGEIAVEWAETQEQAEDIFAELVDLHQARWQSVGQPGHLRVLAF